MSLETAIEKNTKLLEKLDEFEKFYELYEEKKELSTEELGKFRDLYITISSDPVVASWRGYEESGIKLRRFQKFINSRGNKLISNVFIKGYKSIKNCEVKLDNINILFDNSSEESDFISAFNLFSQVYSENFANIEECEKDKITNMKFISDEGVPYDLTIKPIGVSKSCVNYKTNSIDFKKPLVFDFRNTYIYSTLNIKEKIWIDEYLFSNALNLKAVLINIKNNYPTEYQDIVRIIQRVVPYFKDFKLPPDTQNETLTFFY